MTTRYSREEVLALRTALQSCLIPEDIPEEVKSEETHTELLPRVKYAPSQRLANHLRGGSGRGTPGDEKTKQGDNSEKGSEGSARYSASRERGRGRGRGRGEGSGRGIGGWKREDSTSKGPRRGLDFTHEWDKPEWADAGLEKDGDADTRFEEFLNMRSSGGHRRSLSGEELGGLEDGGAEGGLGGMSMRALDFEAEKEMFKKGLLHAGNMGGQGQGRGAQRGEEGGMHGYNNGRGGRHEDVLSGGMLDEVEANSLARFGLDERGVKGIEGMESRSGGEIEMGKGGLPAFFGGGGADMKEDTLGGIEQSFTSKMEGGTGASDFFSAFSPGGGRDKEGAAASDGWGGYENSRMPWMPSDDDKWTRGGGGDMWGGSGAKSGWGGEEREKSQQQSAGGGRGGGSGSEEGARGGGAGGGGFSFSAFATAAVQHADASGHMLDKEELQKRWNEVQSAEALSGVGGGGGAGGLAGEVGRGERGMGRDESGQSHPNAPSTSSAPHFWDGKGLEGTPAMPMPVGGGREGRGEGNFPPPQQGGGIPPFPFTVSGPYASLQVGGSGESKEGRGMGGNNGGLPPPGWMGGAPPMYPPPGFFPPHMGGGMPEGVPARGMDGQDGQGMPKMKSGVFSLADLEGTIPAAPPTQAGRADGGEQGEGAFSKAAAEGVGRSAGGGLDFAALARAVSHGSPSQAPPMPMPMPGGGGLPPAKPGLPITPSKPAQSGGAKSATKVGKKSPALAFTPTQAYRARGGPSPSSMKMRTSPSPSSLRAQAEKEGPVKLPATTREAPLPLPLPIGQPQPLRLGPAVPPKGGEGNRPPPPLQHGGGGGGGDLLQLLKGKGGGGSGGNNPLPFPMGGPPMPMSSLPQMKSLEEIEKGMVGR